MNQQATKILSVLLLLLSISPWAGAADAPGKEAVEPTIEKKKEQLISYCDELIAGKVHRVLIIPKPYGVSSLTYYFESHLVGYLDGDDVKYFVDHLRAPSIISAYDATFGHQVIPLMLSTATSGKYCVLAGGINGCFAIRIRREGFVTDYVYDEEFTHWVMQRLHEVPVSEEK